MDCPPVSFEPLVTAILRRLHAQPAGCAIRFRGSGITHGALLQKVTRLARLLPEAGIESGQRVGVLLERSPDTLVVLLALWSLGAVYVPLDPALPRERLFTMCTVAALDVLITQAGAREMAATLPCALLMLEPLDYDSPQAPLAAVPDPPASVTSDALAYILFTSGSSGQPKGVMISQGNIASLFTTVVPLLELPEGCRILGCANFSFDIALFELLAPLLCNGTLVLADTQACANPARLAQLLEDEQVTMVQATPSHWQLLNALPWSAPLALALATGEALPRVTAADILRRTPVLWNLYGPTECTVWASAQRVRAADLVDTAPATVSIGTALPGYSLQLDNQPEPSADTGELVISGNGVGLGYCDDAADDAAFRSVPAEPEKRLYHSGDLCRRGADGLLHYLGRRDQQVKHNGYRIELDEIALHLQQQASISQAACCVRSANAGATSVLCACVVFKPGMPNKNKSKLNEYLAAYLPSWMLPQRYYFLERLPLTANGKLDRSALLSLTEAPAPTYATDTSLEARIARIFCDVLDIDSIGPCDSFLDAGGSSMLAATLVLSLNEQLGTTLTLRQALNTPPTVGSIVKLLRTHPAPGLPYSYERSDQNADPA